MEVIGGFFKTVCQNSSRKTFKCANSATFYDVLDVNEDRAVFSAVCPNDKKFYQVCGIHQNDGASKTHTLLCGQYVCHGSSENRSSSCTNMDQPATCNNLKSTSICSEEQQNDLECNDVCNVGNCQDESLCNGLTYGRHCESGYYFPIARLRLTPWEDKAMRCHIYDPYPGNPDEFLKEYSGPVCQHYIEGQTWLVPIFNFSRCAPFKYDPRVVAGTHNFWWVKKTEMPFCTDMMDQTNCTDLSRVALSCKIKGYSSNVSRLAICHGITDVRICDDGIENDCTHLSPSCFVHKHKLCDGVSDCEDDIDEEALECKEMAETRCVRVFGSGSLPIPIAWVGDGITDCVSAEDENPDIWHTCGSGSTRRYVRKDHDCVDDFLCMNSRIKFVPQSQLCDMVDTCGNENKICKLAKGQTDLSTTMSKDRNGIDKAVAFCLSGFQSVRTNCTISHFQYPPGNTFGVDSLKLVKMPDQLQNCDFTFGEMYLLASCTGNCVASECPLSRPLRYDSCSGQFADRIYTVRDMEHLTFVTAHRGSFHNEYFLCRNNRCVVYEKVCDLVDDCGDGSDEDNCTNQFQCNSSQIRIPRWQKCDGNINCEDLTDECNEECGKTIIEGIPLKIFSWTIGFLAVAFNCYTCVQSVNSLRSSRSITGLINKSLIMFVSIGDFLVGGYLLSISAVDLLYAASYCLKQGEWLSSLYCSILGIASTIGSQISLFSMACLSITRLYGIKTAMNLSGRITRRSVTRVVIILLMIVGSSVGIAVTPILPQFEDFFVNGMSYDKKNPMFVGFPGKEVHLQVIQAYYGRMRRNKNFAISWRMTLELIDGMFSTTYGGLKRRKVDFYGNDGVCLFKYFVTAEDPQKIFSWSILAINFFCFVIITISYIIINTVSVQSGKSLARNNRQINKRNRKMQRKISIIIATDFICWLPFVLVCCLHSLAVLDATPWYALFSLVILPINSVINPLLYDDTLIDLISRPFNNIRYSLTGSLSSVRNRDRDSTIVRAIDIGKQLSSSQEIPKLDPANQNEVETKI